MASYLSSAPSSLSQELQLFCNSLLPHHFHHLSIKPKPRTRKTTPLQISLQESNQTSNSPSNTKTSSRSKSSVWINPDSPRASKLRQKISQGSINSSLLDIAKSLDSCSATEEDVKRVLDDLGDKVAEYDAVLILNNMSNPDTAVLAADYFRQRVRFRNEVVLYNVTLKVLRKSKDLSRAEKVFDEMCERGVKPDNITFSTIISCARQCNLPKKAVEWFEKMPSFGCDPDDVTYSNMIDNYGKAGNMEMALSLYNRARDEKWRIDAMTFSTLIRIFGLSGDFDGCLNAYEEMKALGVKPSLKLYNNLLDAMGRARRPWQAKKIYNNMIKNGIEPGWGTYAALIRAYARARYGEDAMNVYKEMKEKGMGLNTNLYNTLLTMCADVGLTDEVVEIYKDMKGFESENCRPDIWTYSSLITAYSCCGKVSEAEAVVDEMTEQGVKPDICVLTSLIQCYGKANRTDDVVRTCDQLLDLGLTPDERFCGSLLNVLTQTPKEEMYKLAVCIEKANPKLGYIVNLLIDEDNIEGEVLKREASELLNSMDIVFRKPYCNCLIDVCVNLNRVEKACELFNLGMTLDIYTNIQLKESNQWSLQLKSLSSGAALTALHIWMNDMNEAIENGEELPPLLGINTGHGKHKYSDKVLTGVFKSRLKELHAPFHQETDLPGWFLTTDIAATSWLESIYFDKRSASQELVSTQA